MRKTETLNLRVSPEFKRRLEEEAKRERRSVTNYLEATLEKHWQECESKKKVSKKKREGEELT
jgi:predicted HicB family RNase H-like nuclease